MIISTQTKYINISYYYFYNHIDKREIIIEWILNIKILANNIFYWNFQEILDIIKYIYKLEKRG